MVGFRGIGGGTDESMKVDVWKAYVRLLEHN